MIFFNMIFVLHIHIIYIYANPNTAHTHTHTPHHVSLEKKNYHSHKNSLVGVRLISEWACKDSWKRSLSLFDIHAKKSRKIPRTVFPFKIHFRSVSVNLSNVFYDYFNFYCTSKNPMSSTSLIGVNSSSLV